MPSSSKPSFDIVVERIAFLLLSSSSSSVSLAFVVSIYSIIKDLDLEPKLLSKRFAAEMSIPSTLKPQMSQLQAEGSDELGLGGGFSCC
jgi:hypothetical protein